jgi:hypothetical protein
MLHSNASDHCDTVARQENNGAGEPSGASLIKIFGGQLLCRIRRSAVRDGSLEMEWVKGNNSMLVVSIRSFYNKRLSKASGVPYSTP